MERNNRGWLLRARVGGGWQILGFRRVLDVLGVWAATCHASTRGKRPCFSRVFRMPGEVFESPALECNLTEGDLKSVQNLFTDPLLTHVDDAPRALLHGL